ncbi:hypothetical protein VTO73DRAFT_6337 [Trametes versicolor]
MNLYSTPTIPGTPTETVSSQDVQWQLRKAQMELAELKAELAQGGSSQDQNIVGRTRPGGIMGGSAQGYQSGGSPLVETEYVPAREKDGTLVSLTRDRRDFPKVQIWDISDWKEDDSDSIVPGKKRGQRGRGRMAKGENVRFRFIVEPSGEPVSGFVLQEIGQAFNRFCNELKVRDRAALPPRWKTDACATVKSAFFAWMRSQFFAFQLCSNNWKAEQYAVLTYPSWKQNHLKPDEADANTEKQTTVKKARTKSKPTRKARRNAKAKGKGKGRASEDSESDDSASDEAASDDPVDENDSASLSGAPYTTTPHIDDEDYQYTNTPHLLDEDYLSRPASLPGTPKRNAPDAAAASEVRAKRPRLSSLDTNVSTPTTVTAPVRAPQDLEVTPEPNTTTPLSSPDTPHATIEPPALQGRREGTTVAPVVVLEKGPAAVANVWGAATMAASSGSINKPVKSPATVPTTTTITLEAKTELMSASTSKIPGEKRVRTSRGPWPPTGSKPKPICGRYWAAQNPAGTQEQFDTYYFKLGAYERKELRKLAEATHSLSKSYAIAAAVAVA